MPQSAVAGVGTSDTVATYHDYPWGTKKMESGREAVRVYEECVLDDGFLREFLEPAQLTRAGLTR